MKTFSLKVSDNDPVAVYLASQPNISAALRAIVEDFLARGSAGRPPPAREPEPQPPAPVVSIDYERFGRVMYRAVRKAMQKEKIAMAGNAALNETEDWEKPEENKRDPLLDMIEGGLGTWG